MVTLHTPHTIHSKTKEKSIGKIYRYAQNLKDEEICIELQKGRYGDRHDWIMCET